MLNRESRFSDFKKKYANLLSKINDHENDIQKFLQEHVDKNFKFKDPS